MLAMLNVDIYRARRPAYSNKRKRALRGNAIHLNIFVATQAANRVERVNRIYIIQSERCVCVHVRCVRYMHTQRHACALGTHARVQSYSDDLGGARARKCDTYTREPTFIPRGGTRDRECLARACAARELCITKPIRAFDVIHNHERAACTRGLCKLPSSHQEH